MVPSSQNPTTPNASPHSPAPESAPRKGSPRASEFRNAPKMSDPEYRYPVSKNPYWERLKEFEGRIFWDNHTEEHLGHWRQKFPCTQNSPLSPEARRPLHVELGCNGGHVTLEWAARDPQALFIGLDWKHKQIHRGAEKALKRKIDNLLFFRANSERLRFVFGEGEIDHLYLYFPDPWAKKSQLKNRWLTTHRLREVAPLVRTGGTFHIKTDHAGYYEWMCEALNGALDLWTIEENTANLHAAHPDPRSLKIPDVTLFERLFIADGLPVHSIRLKRR